MEKPKNKKPMKVQKVYPVSCPYCSRIKYLFPKPEEEASFDIQSEKIKCGFCKRTFILKDLPI